MLGSASIRTKERVLGLGYNLVGKHLPGMHKTLGSKSLEESVAKTVLSFPGLFGHEQV